eukprot:1134257-Prorocentrum_minimum.AAC.7
MLARCRKGVTYIPPRGWDDGTKPLLLVCRAAKTFRLTQFYYRVPSRMDLMRAFYHMTPPPVGSMLKSDSSILTGEYF